MYISSVRCKFPYITVRSLKKDTYIGTYMRFSKIYTKTCMKENVIPQYKYTLMYIYRLV